MEIKVVAFDDNGNTVNIVRKWVPDAEHLRAYVQCQRNNPRTVAVQYSVEGDPYPAVYFSKHREPYEPDPAVFDVHYNPNDVMSRTVQ